MHPGLECGTAFGSRARKFHLSLPPVKLDPRISVHSAAGAQEMEVVMKVLNRMQDRLDQFKDMIAQADVEFAGCNGYALENEMREALIRCILCRHTQTCREWLDSDEASRGEPNFCPNAPFVNRYRRLEHPSRRAA